MSSNRLINIFTLILVAGGISLTTFGQNTKRPSPSIPARIVPADQQITVGPNFQASKAYSDKAHNETHVAANPRNPLNLVGGSMVWLQEKNKQTVVAYASFDGGKTWSPTLTFDDDFYHSDPAAGFSPDGTAFFLQITNTSGREPKYYTHVYRSKDGGKTWLPPTIIPMLDRHYIAFDRFQDARRNWLFINGATSRALKFGRSKDGGTTFDEERAALSIPTGRFFGGMAPIQTLSDGKVVIPFFDADPVGPRGEREEIPTKPNAILKVTVSENGGDSFSEPVTITDVGLGHGLRSDAHHFGSSVDQSDGPFKDRLYVVWSDSFFSGGGGVTVRRSNGSKILLSYSADGGKTWSKPTLINDDPPSDSGRDPVHFHPVAAVNRDGAVGVMWYDRRDSTNGIDYTTRFAASLDGGDTFLSSVKVSEAPSEYNKFEKMVISARPYGGGQRPMNRAFWGGPLKIDLNISQFNLAGGHTAGLTADALGAFHPFWIDNRTGVSQIWTASVTVQGKAVPNGSPELSMLEDLSGRVLLKLTNPRFDLAAGRLTVTATFQNVSEETITGPVKLQVTSIASKAGGIATVIGPNSKETKIGAIWDFSDFLIDNQLKPNQTSKEKRLEFQVSGVPPLTETRLTAMGWGALELLHIEARVLGNIEKKS